MKARAKVRWGPLLIAAALVLGTVTALAAPGDIVFEREGGAASVEPAFFPHWVHRIRYRCYVCHPSIFEMNAGATQITMQSIRDGEHCGTCHNGNTAFPVDFKNCSRCHATPEE